MARKFYLFAFYAIFAFSGFFGYGQEATKAEKLFALSLEELMNVEIDIGTLTGSTQSTLPLSLTTITAEDIRCTPARNIYDLMEIYVPGALWRYHSEGPHPGIRGIITDLNYKLLVLVNGRNMNQKAHNGATSELENWDLSDIEKIEVIRGPGSVTYGPGAIMGIINIVTKNAKSCQGTQVGVNYVSEYNSKGLYINHALNKKNYDLYVYGSMTRTQGISPKALLTSGYWLKSGYMGTGFINSSFYRDPPQDYFNDFNNDPQYKLYVESNFLQEWKAWARYVNSGSSVPGGYSVFPKYQIQIGLDGEKPLYSDFLNCLKMKNEHFTVALENNHEFPGVMNGLQLKSMISWDSENYLRGKLPNYYSAADSVPPEIQSQLADPDSVRNKYASYSEDELLVRTIAVLNFNNKYKIALGMEGSYNRWGPEWGKSEKEMRMGDQANIFSGTNSNLFAGSGGITQGYFVGDGWSTTMLSFLGEATLRFHPKFTLLLSGREDKDTYSKWLFSPRIALISELDEQNVVKLIWQRSNRMNTAEQLLVEHREGNQSEPEILESFELMYTRRQGGHLLFNAAVFYNQLDVIAWNDNEKSSKVVGDLKLWGLEIEARYQSEHLTIGINHSYIKQINWDLAQGLNASGISYSDYLETAQFKYAPTTLLLTGIGNNLNNWANHATKIFGRLNLFNNRVICHTDARVFWGYEGGKDGIQMRKNAVDGSAYEQDCLEVFQTLESKDVFGIDFRLDASITWKLSEVLSLQLYTVNLLGSADNKRYTYDAGADPQLIPNSIGWIEEPRAVGIKLSAHF